MRKNWTRIFLGMLCFCLLTGGTASADRAERQVEAIPMRGIIEGFYGTPWSQEARLRMLQFMGKHALNTYIYAPKDDPYHREKWREPYPEAQMEQLQLLIRTAQENQVEFVFGISPGLDLHFSGAAGEQDMKALLLKMNALYDLGVRQFAIFFDDIQNKDALAQTRVLNEVNRRFVHEKKGVKPLFTVPTEYFSADMMDTKGPKEYTGTFAARLDPDVLVMYTGPGVVCPGIPLQDIEKIEHIYQRKMSVWWNYPVTDYMQSKLALGPITGMETGAAVHMAAFLMNPMEHEALSELALATGADYTNAPSTYDAEASWEKALQEQYAGQAADMKLFAEHSQHMENNWARAGRADAPLLRAHMDALWQAVQTNADTQAERTVLQADLKELAAGLQRLQTEPPRQLQQEGMPQLVLLQQLVQADQDVLFLLQADEAGQKHLADGFYQKLLRERDALPSEAKVRISDKTARAFLDEAIDWYEHKKLDLPVQ